MEQMDNFEKLIRERMNGERSPISDNVWKNIQSTLPMEENKVRGIRPLYYFAALGFIFFTTIVYFNYYSFNTSDKFVGGSTEAVTSQELKLSANAVVKKTESSAKHSRINKNPLSETETDKETGQFASDYKNHKAFTTSNDGKNNYSGSIERNSDSHHVTELAFSTASINEIRSKDIQKSLEINSKEGMDYNSSKKASTQRLIGHEQTISSSTDITKQDYRSTNETKNTKQEINRLNESNNISNGANTVLNEKEIENKNTFNGNERESIISSVNNEVENKKGTLSYNSIEDIFSGKPGDGDDLTKVNSDTYLRGTNDNEINGTDRGIKSQSVVVLAKAQVEIEKGEDTTTVDSKKIEIPLEALSVKQKKKKEAFNTPPLGVELFLTPTISKTRDDSSSASSIADKANPKITFGAGVRLKMELNEKWRVGMGVNYSSYGDRYIINTESEKEQLHVKYNIHQDTLGGWVYQPIDTVKFTKSDAKKHVAVNSFKYIGIPVFVGYQVLDGKIGLTLTGGLTTNFLTYAETNTFLANGTSAVLVKTESSKDENSLFRPVTFNVFLSPGLTYKVNDKLKVIVDPGFTWFINSVYKSDNSVNRRIIAMECRTGVQFTFGR